MDANENTNWTAEMDQSRAGARDFATVVAMFYKGLREEGLGKLEAAHITGSWASSMQRSASGSGEQEGE